MVADTIHDGHQVSIPRVPQASPAGSPGGGPGAIGPDAARSGPPWWHTQVQPGRRTAHVEDPMAVFLIGARINKPLRIRSWGWVVRSMGPMMARLAEVPDLGLLHVEQFSRGRTSLSVQYWRSLDHLMAFAADRDNPHLEAWRRFNRELRDRDDVGIWHETYVVQPGAWEGMYVNMPHFGMGAALGSIPIVAGRDRARQRMDVAA